MATITKKELADMVADRAGLAKPAVRELLQSFLAHMIAELGKGNRLEFRDFGVFEVRSRKPRVAQNPKTLVRVAVPAKRSIKFKVGRLMRARLDGQDVPLPGLDADADGAQGAQPAKASRPRDVRKGEASRPLRRAGKARVSTSANANTSAHASASKAAGLGAGAPSHNGVHPGHVKPVVKPIAPPGSVPKLGPHGPSSRPG
jgi:integration host factor subunit beta